ncbi:MAG: S-layer homology domain-containing protein [Oscillospiraceae bacterium]|nr:S-layer homology domain-containing protein [Oscillospiraceae bacterium]
MKNKKTSMRMFSIVLSAILCLSLIPVFGSKASAASVTVSTMDELYNALTSYTTQTVILSKDISGSTSTADGQWCIIHGTKVLDLAGHDIDISNDTSTSKHLLFYVQSGADLTINDTKGGGVITYNGYINDNGTLRVRNIFTITDDAKVTMNGGTVRAGRSKDKYYASLAQTLPRMTFGTAFTVKGNGELIINNGTVEGRGRWVDPNTYESTNCYAIEAASKDAKVTIYNGQFYGHGAAPCVRRVSTSSIFVVKAGLFSCDSPKKLYINGKGYNFYDASSTGLSTAMINSSESTYTINKGTYLSDATSVTVSAKWPTISTSSLEAGTVGSPYARAVYCSSGAEPISYSVTSGGIPSGLKFYSTGYLSGTPTAPGTYSFVVKAQNYVGSTTKTISVVIKPAPSASITSQPVSSISAVDGSTIKLSVSASNASSYQWQYYNTSSNQWTNVVDGQANSSAPTYSGAKTATLTIKTSYSYPKLQYRCVITGQDGKTVNSNTATVSVTPTVLSKVNVSVNAPAVGTALPQATKAAAYGPKDQVLNDCKIVKTEWICDGKIIPAGTIAVGGKIYTVRVSITPYSGYRFDGTTKMQINSNTAYVENLPTTGTEAILRYSFSKTPEYVFPFTDVPTSAWYYSWVRSAHQMGLINGETPTLFRPLNNLTYAAAVKLAACMHQLYTEGKVTLTNGSPNWYDSYYQYCRNKGIIQQNSDAFQPGYADLYKLANQYITREMYVYLFARSLPDAAFPVKNNIPDNSIPDVPVTMGVWDDGIYKFYRAGITNGTNSYGTFLPDSLIDRGSVAAILVRMMDPSTRVGPPANLGK